MAYITPLPDRDTLERVVLEKIRFGLRPHVGPEFLSDLRVEASLDRVGEQIALEIHGKLLGKRMDEVRDIQTEHRTEVLPDLPCTWIDHYKMSVWPKWGRLGQWLLERYPPSKHAMTLAHHKTYNRTIQRTNVCPHSTQHHERDHITFLLTGEGHEPQRGGLRDPGTGVYHRHSSPYRGPDTD